jgi:multidrug efflux system membrane fusion protein
VPVQVAVAQKLDVPRRITAIGNVQPLRTVSVKSQVDGIIAEVHFREGDEVKAGDLLVTLDRRPIENSLRIAKADLANAKAEASKASTDADRYNALNQQDAISKEQFGQLITKQETTRAQVQAKEAAVANAELQFGYTQIRAPIAGRTGQLMLHEGALVKANDAAQSIVTINQLTPAAVAFSVPEAMLPQIRAAQAAKALNVSVHSRNTNVDRSNGQLDFIDNTVDATTGTILLKAVFPNDDHVLWPGQFLDVATDVGVDAGAIVVPSVAVQTAQTGSQIYVVKADQTVELRPVEVLRTAGDLTLLAKGVAAGETVVTDGQLRLVPGAKIEAKVLGAPPAPKPANSAKGNKGAAAAKP